jgi:hypothetical protein
LTIFYNVKFFTSGSQRFGKDSWTHSETVLPGKNIFWLFLLYFKHDENGLLLKLFLGGRGPGVEQESPLTRCICAQSAQ